MRWFIRRKEQVTDTSDHNEDEGSDIFKKFMEFLRFMSMEHQLAEAMVRQLNCSHYHLVTVFLMHFVNHKPDRAQQYDFVDTVFGKLRKDVMHDVETKYRGVRDVMFRLENGNITREDAEVELEKLFGDTPITPVLVQSAFNKGNQI